MAERTSIGIGEMSRPPAAQFETVGDRCKGKIVSLSVEQQTNMDTGQLMFWQDGRPREMVVLVLSDNGELASLYARGGNFKVASGEGVALWNAITEAAAAAGATDIEMGATLEVVHSGLGTKEGGKNPPKLYRARYTKPPKAAVATDRLFSDDEGEDTALAPAAAAPAPTRSLFEDEEGF
jgi:hypothetical protein